MQRKPLLEVRDLTTIFDTPKGPLRAVDGVSFTVERGKSHGIVGESGSGKSVLVRTIMNLLPGSASVVQGSVTFDGTAVARSHIAVSGGDLTIRLGTVAAGAHTVRFSARVPAAPAAATWSRSPQRAS